MAHRKTVLTVDDNTQVLCLVRAILLENGFRVQIARDGIEGLDCFHKHQHELCLVITDLVMPKMNGLELARAIRAIDPDLPVLFISGFYENPEGLGEFPVVLKPFSANTLLNAVHSAVEN